MLWTVADKDNRFDCCLSDVRSSGQPKGEALRPAVHPANVGRSAFICSLALESTWAVGAEIRRMVEIIGYLSLFAATLGCMFALTLAFGD